MGISKLAGHGTGFIGCRVSSKINVLVVEMALCNEFAVTDCYSVWEPPLTYSNPAANSSVSHVVGLCSGPQVGRLTACAIITTGTAVKNVGPLFSDFVAAKHNPSNTMRKCNCTLSWPGIPSKCSISSVVESADPQKTSCGLISAQIAIEPLYVAARKIDLWCHSPSILVQRKDVCQGGASV